MTVPACWEVPEPLARLRGARGGRRRERFESPEDYAERLARRSVFERVDPGTLDLFARTTLRRTADGTGYELRCPREYEAQISKYVYCWSMTVNYESIRCPVKAIGADPTVEGTFMPSLDIRDFELLDYEFVPESTHLLPLEKPDVCADLGPRVSRIPRACLMDAGDRLTAHRGDARDGRTRWGGDTCPDEPVRGTAVVHNPNRHPGK